MNAKTKTNKNTTGPKATFTVNKAAKTVTFQTSTGTHTLRAKPATNTSKAKVEISSKASQGSRQFAPSGVGSRRTLSPWDFGGLGRSLTSPRSRGGSSGGGNQRVAETVLNLPKAKVNTVQHPKIKAMIQTYGYDPQRATHPFDAAMNAEESGVAYNMGGSFSGHKMEVEHTKEGLLFKSRDFLQDIAISIGNNPGDVLYSLPINPSLFANTRTALIAAAFQFCRVKKLHVMWKTRANASQSGAVLLFADNDPYFPVGSGVGGERQGESDPSSNDIPVWYNGGFIFHNLQPAWLATDPVSPDRRWSEAGTIYLMLTGSVPADMVYGSLIIETEIEFRAELLTARSLLGFSNSYLTGGSPSAALPWGGSPTLDSPSNLTGMSLYFDGSTLQMRFLPGYYLFTGYVSGTGLATGFSWTAGPGVTLAASGSYHYGGAVTGTFVAVVRFFTVSGGDFESPTDRQVRVYLSALTTQTGGAFQVTQTPKFVEPPAPLTEQEMLRTVYSQLTQGQQALPPMISEAPVGSFKRYLPFG